MKRLRWAVRALAAVLVLLAVVGPGQEARAHPLGNFSTNTAAAVTVRTDGIHVRYVVDLAEIPAYHESEVVHRQGQTEYADRTCARLADGLDVLSAGKRIGLRTSDATLSFPPGAAGLATQRLECELEAGAVPDGQTVRLVDANYTDRQGWHEITVKGDSVGVQSDAPATSPSATLTAYPESGAAAPLDEREASFTATRSGPTRTEARVEPAENETSTESQPRGLDGASRWFASFVARRELTLGFGLVAVAIALVLGALHAAAPGHGKTLMAGYLVAERGTRRDAFVIAATVTVTHTAGVALLGLTLGSIERFAPERIYPWLGVLSGLLVASAGIGLLLRARRRSAAQEPPDQHHHHHQHRDHHHHHHLHGHGHGHVDDRHGHAEADLLVRTDAPAPGRPGLDRRGLMAMGVAGGLVPSPSALVVLLGAAALGRAWFGLTLVVAYGAGMAATLVGVGMVLDAMRGRLEAGLDRLGDRWTRATSLIGPAAAVLIVCGGVFVAIRSVALA